VSSYSVTSYSAVHWRVCSCPRHPLHAQLVATTHTNIYERTDNGVEVITVHSTKQLS